MIDIFDRLICHLFRDLYVYLFDYYSQLEQFSNVADVYIPNHKSIKLYFYLHNFVTYLLMMTCSLIYIFWNDGQEIVIFKGQVT